MRFNRMILLASLFCLVAPDVTRAAWNLPDGKPSTIQSYIDDPTKCPPPASSGGGGGCHLVLPCGQWDDDRSGNQIVIDGKSNVRISGCGMNGTTIRFTDPPGGGKLLLITGASRWITVEDLKLEIECSSDCSNNSAYAGHVDGGSADVTFERVHFHAVDKSSSTAFAPKPGGLQIGTASSKALRVNAYACNFHAHGYGLSVNDCDDCWFSSSWFGPMNGFSRPSFALANKASGFGVRFTNNTFDMGGDLQSGLVLRTNSGEVKTASTAQVQGNSFVNIQDSWSSGKQFGIYMYGYNRANILGNLFACEPPIEGDESCTANGIEFISNASNCGQSDVCNHQNAISDNVFDRLVDDSLLTCPIRFASGATVNQNNVVHGNVFKLGDGSASGANGICGANEPLNQNVSDNVVFTP